MKSFSKAVLLLTLSFCLFGCGHNQSSKISTEQPNIVFIMADDMGYGDASCYNSESKIQTPNIDQLASEGIQLTDAHTPSSVCTPTRYGLLTGRYCWRTRVKKGVILGYDETPLIDMDRTTLASILKQAGYGTACIGKWHLGMNWETKGDYVIQDDENKWVEYSGAFKENEENIDFTKPVSGGPTELGFDYFFGTLGCSTGDNPYCFIENERTVGIPSVMLPEKWLGLPGVVTALMEPSWSMEEVDPIFTAKAIDFIDLHMENEPKKPFFLYLALSSPHIPFLPPDFTKGKSKEGGRGDLVLVVDWSVGEIKKTLTRHGITDNTLFIFTSDNGPRKGGNGHASAGQLRGRKGTIWEGGHRVPFIAKWPGQIEPGTMSNQTISLTDMLASFGALTGQKIESGNGEDSYNVLPALLGEQITAPNEQVRIFHSAAGAFSIRKGKWKLIEGSNKPGTDRLVVNQDLSLKEGILYNMEEDPYEKVDLFDENPDIVNELFELLNEIKK